MNHADFISRELRKQNREKLKQELEKELQKNSAAYWSKQLNQAGVPAGEVLSVPQALELQQIRERGFLEKFEEVPGLEKPVQLVRTGIQLNGKPLSVQRPPPQLGEDTHAILKDCGYNDGEIANFHQEKVI